MNNNVMKNILNLKEQEGFSILELFISKENDELKMSFDMDTELNEIYRDFIDELVILNMSLLKVYGDEIQQDLEKLKSVPTIKISVTADKEGNTVSLYLPYIKVYKKGADEILEMSKILIEKMDKKLNDLLDNYVAVEDSLREFELVYKRNDDGEFKYCDFNRMIDRKISEQKYEISQLMSLGFEDKLIDKLKEVGYDLDKVKNEEIVIAFETDMKDIYNIKLGVYPF